MVKLSHKNLAEFLIKNNKKLIDGQKWYDLTPSKLPQSMQDKIKHFLAEEYFKLPENNGQLGKFIFDGKLIAVPDKIFKDIGLSKKKINLNLEIFLKEDLKDIRINYGLDIANYIQNIRRKYNKDYYDKKLKKWRKQAKDLDENNDNVYVLRKRKELGRSRIERLKWDLIGEPDSFNDDSNSRSPYQKEKNSKDPNANPEVLKKIFLKAINEFEECTKNKN